MRRSSSYWLNWRPSGWRPSKRSAEFKAKLAALEDETKKIVAELVAEGEVERQKIIDAAHKQADYIKQQAQLAIQQEIKAAKESLQEEVGDYRGRSGKDPAQESETCGSRSPGSGFHDKGGGGEVVKNLIIAKRYAKALFNLAAG